VTGHAARRFDDALVKALAVVCVGVIASTLIQLLGFYPYGVDLEIPLRAASRWLAGGQPYLPESFKVIAGPDLPFLYPPIILPLIAAASAVPRLLLFPIWTAVCVTSGVFACRRLAMPWWLIPLVLAWPPFAEALLGGNIQVPLFAAFTALLYRGGGDDLRTEARDPRAADAPLVGEGVLATAIGAIKLSLAHTWLFVLRRRPRAAIAGAAVVAAVVIVTLPLVGVDRWVDWFGQAGKSGDPAWQAVGWPLSRAIGRVPGLIVTALTLAAVFVIPIPRAGAWLGILTVIGAPSLHIFGLIFLVPAMLGIRRDIALLGALLIATYTELGLVSGAALVTIAFALSSRVPILSAGGHAAVDV
jgi:hypothetical protein